jgi:DNA-binding transcriptional LysR family regulator
MPFAMEIRTLRNFAAVVRAGNVTRAAAALHVSQPALSMQLRELEEELGGPLLVRRARGVEPTERGSLLLRRADDIVALADRTRDEVRAEGSGGLTGTLAVGAGETLAFGAVGRALAALRAENPHLRIAVTSGNGPQIDDAIRSGTLDLALFVGPLRFDGYDYLVLPHVHRWGLYLRRDAPLAEKKAVRPRDLDGLPLAVSGQAGVADLLSGWLGRDFLSLDIAATYNLAYNALALVAAGLGAAVGIDGVLPAPFADALVFRPFRPLLKSDVYLAWRKGVPLTPAAAALLARLRAVPA